MKKTLIFSVLALVISMPSLAVKVQPKPIAKLIEIGKFHNAASSNNGKYYSSPAIYTAWCVGNKAYLSISRKNSRSSAKSIKWESEAPSVENIQPLNFFDGKQYRPVSCAEYESYRDRELIFES